MSHNENKPTKIGETGMNKTARLIITMDCSRNCSYCCNKYDSILSKAIHIKKLSEIADYDTVCITGGEPSLDPIRTIEIINSIKQISNPIIYLYTALFDVGIPFKKVDGIHYTLHENTNGDDIYDFISFQHAASGYRNKSFRLFIHPGINHSIAIIPSVWSRIESNTWINEKDCQLPEGETLFILDSY